MLETLLKVVSVAASVVLYSVAGISVLMFILGMANMIEKYHLTPSVLFGG